MRIADSTTPFREDASGDGVGEHITVQFQIFGVILLVIMSNAPERIAIPDLEKKLEGKSKPVVIDVRKQAEIDESGAVPGALHIPVEKVGERVSELPKDKELAFYCGGGGRASRAAQSAWDAGFRSVSYFGLRDWKKRGLPTSKTAKKF